MLTRVFGCWMIKLCHSLSKRTPTVAKFCEAIPPLIVPMLQMRIYGTSTKGYGLAIEVPVPKPDGEHIGILVREVSAGAQQFHSLDDLQEAIVAAWERINEETVQKLLLL